MATWFERTTYRLKLAAPWAYDLMAWGNAVATRLLFGRRIRRALDQATLKGSVFGRPAVMRPLDECDTDVLAAMFAGLSDEHLCFFRPHALEGSGLRRVLRARAMLTYGLFVDGRIVGYALIKLFFTKKAYIGRLVVPEYAGRGVGKFLVRYLYWQGALLDLVFRATVHRENLASRRSQEAVRPHAVIARLPHGYDMIQYTILPEDRETPVLNVPPAAQEA